ncbi:MAG TPA: hypothetical protein VKB46_17860, partial [Pyrinomonadaceae bacterium]|nr:hypothetical protein [Pyrinomonadaceae bacterium]
MRKKFEFGFFFVLIRVISWIVLQVVGVNGSTKSHELTRTKLTLIRVGLTSVGFQDSTLMKAFNTIVLLISASALLSAQSTSRQASVREVNQVAQPPATSTIAIVGATLIDGRGGPAVPDSIVIIHGDRIATVGNRVTAKIPQGAEVVDARGLTLLPGLIDAHFHIDGDDPLPALYLSHGITSIRDPGQWIEAYDVARKGPAAV